MKNTKLRYTTKSVKGFTYSGLEYKGIGIFDNNKGMFVEMGDNKPYTPAGGYKAAKEISVLCNNDEIIGGVKLINHDK